MKNKSLFILKIICMLSILQLSLYGLKYLLFIFFERTIFTDHMASMISMMILTIIILLFSKLHKLELSIFPKKFSLGYIIYSSIVTPLYEEIIFRGIIWNQLEKFWRSKIAVYLINAVLFGLWHLGYVGSIAFRVSDGLLNIMIWKVIIGLAFSLVLGLVRLKTKNCYSTILTHGIMNLFGR